MVATTVVVQCSVKETSVFVCDRQSTATGATQHHRLETFAKVTMTVHCRLELAPVADVPVDLEQLSQEHPVLQHQDVPQERDLKGLVL